MHKSMMPALIAMILLLLWPVNGFAASPGALVAKGNRAYSAGNYDEAISAYDKAAADAPQSPYIYFNKGAALYKKGDYQTAAKAFEQAALKSKDAKLEAKSKFNLGNCAFREVEGQKKGDLNKALKACEKSIRYYQEALKLNPDFKAAAENIEVVRLVMKNILDEISKRKQEAQKQQAARKQKPETHQEKALKELKDVLRAHQKNQGGQGQAQKEQPNAQPQPEKQQGPGQTQNKAQQPIASQKNQANPEKNQDPNQAQAMQTQASDDARGILDEEKENQQQRRLLGLGGHRDVDKDW